MITTNGYLLTKQNVRRLRQAGVRHFHITLDGSGYWHDRFRIHKEKGRTYRVILDNLLRVIDILPDSKITLRVNYNRKSFDGIGELFDVFPEEQRGRVQLIFRQIFGEKSDGCTLPDKSRRELALYKEASAKGFDLSLAETLTAPKETYCYADKQGAMIVNPRGEIFKCGVGKFEHASRMGDLLPDGTIRWIEDKMKAWNDIDGFSDQQCRACRFLPLCMGGCRANRLKGRTDVECRQPFELIYEMLKQRYGGARHPCAVS